MTTEEMKRNSRENGFNFNFWTKVLPYFDCIDKWGILMSLFNKSMKKYWNRNEGVLLSTGLFTRRLLIVTDEYLESIDYETLSTSNESTNDEGTAIIPVPFSGCKFSYYKLELVAINFIKNYERLMKRIFSIIENDKNVPHQFKYIFFTRVVAFRLSMENEKLLISYLAEKNRMSEIDIYYLKIYNN